jgi:hypothetical protein
VNGGRLFEGKSTMLPLQFPPQAGEVATQETSRLDCAETLHEKMQSAATMRRDKSREERTGTGFGVKIGVNYSTCIRDGAGKDSALTKKARDRKRLLPRVLRLPLSAQRGY